MLVQMAIVSELQAYTFCGYTIKHPVCKQELKIGNFSKACLDLEHCMLPRL